MITPTMLPVNFSESIFEQINSLIFLDQLNFKPIHSSTKFFNLIKMMQQVAHPLKCT